jgi:hypothetical protein
MFRVKHFGRIGGLRKRTFGARGMIQSRDLERAKEYNRVYLANFVTYRLGSERKRRAYSAPSLALALIFLTGGGFHSPVKASRFGA